MQRLNYPVDIIIPFKNNYYEITECVSSLFRNTLGVNYTLTIIDDGSTNKEFIKTFSDKLKNLPVQILINETSKGFGASVNIGIEKTLNKWICILHADCVAHQQDWLLQLLNTRIELDKQKVRFVSSCMNNAGNCAYDETVLRKLEKDYISDKPLPLAACLFARKLLQDIKGPIKEYVDSGFENEDLFWRMKLLGYNQAVSSRSKIMHNSKVKKFNNLEEKRNEFIKDIQEFKAKWIK